MQIVSRKIFSQYYNGSNFLSNLSDSNLNLAGNVMEAKRAVYTINVDVRSQAFTGNAFSINSTTNVISRQFGSFIDDGFSIGDSFICDYNTTGGTNSFEGNIISITDNQIFFNVTSGSAVDSNSQRFDIYLTSFLTGLNFNFGLVENSEAFTSNSPFDSTSMGWYVDGVGVDTGGGVRSTATISGQPLSFNINKSWVYGSFTAQFVQNLNNGYGNYIQQFQIEHTFIVFPYYLDGELTNLQTLTPPNDFNGSNSLKYVSRYEFRRVLSDPNSSKTLIDENIIGSVGWFNEPFNGLNQPFSVLNLSYEDTGSNVIPRIVANTDTIVKFTVNSTSSSFSNTTNLISYVSFLPSLAEYQNKNNTFQQNFLYDNYLGVANGTNNVIGSPFVIKEAKYTFIDANNIDVELKVDFNDSRIDDTDYYLIAIEVASDGGTNQVSDKTNLLVAVDTFEKSADIQGLITKNFLEFELYPEALGTNQYTNIRGWVEDSINVNYNFTVNRALNAVLNELDAKIVAYNTNDGTWFELEKINIPLTSTIITGNQFINYDIPRSFNAPQGEYNRIKVTTNAINTTTPNYTVNLSIKIDWQDWLALPNADTVFFNINEPNNGLNENASNYSLKSGYEIRVLFDHLVQESVQQVVTNYVHSSPQNEIYNYDEDDNVTPEFSGIIEVFDSNGVSLGTDLIVGQTNTIKSTFTPTGPLNPLNTYYVTILIEPINSPTKNAIKIYDATLSIVSGDLVAEYILPSSELQSGVNYKISSRLRCFEQTITHVAIPTPTYLNNGNYQINQQYLDGATPLPNGTVVKMIWSGTGLNYEFETVIGADLSTTTVTNIVGDFNADIKPYINAGSNITNGGNIVFRKQDWATANGYLDASAKQITIELLAFYNGNYNENLDRFCLLDFEYYRDRWLFSQRYTTSSGSSLNSIEGHRIASFLNNGTTSLLTNNLGDIKSWYNATGTSFANSADNNDPVGGFVASGDTFPWLGSLRSENIVEIPPAPSLFMNGGGIDLTAIGSVASMFSVRSDLQWINSVLNFSIDYDGTSVNSQWTLRDFNNSIGLTFTDWSVSIIDGGTIELPSSYTAIVSPFVVTGGTVLGTETVTQSLNNPVSSSIPMSDYGIFNLLIETTRSDGGVFKWLAKFELKRF